MSSSPRSDNTRSKRKPNNKEQGNSTANHTNNKPNGNSQPHKQQSQPQQQTQTQQAQPTQQQAQPQLQQAQAQPQPQPQQAHPPQQNGQKHNPTQDRRHNHSNHNKQQPEQTQTQHQKHPSHSERRPPQQPQTQTQTQTHQPHLQPRQQHDTDFIEIEQHLQHLWNSALDQTKDSPSSIGKPIIYQDSSKAWGGESKLSLLSNFNFPAELKKAYLSKYASRFPPKTDPSSEKTGKDEEKKDEIFVSEPIHSTNTPTPIPTPTTSTSTSTPTPAPTDTVKNVHYDIHSQHPDPINRDQQINTTGDTINSTTPQPNGKPKKGKPSGKEDKKTPSPAPAKEEKKPAAPEPEPAETGANDDAAGDDVAPADEYDYGFTNTAYEEISDPQNANPGDVIIDIGDVGDDDVLATSPRVKKAPKKKSKKAKKQKNANSNSIDDDIDMILNSEANHHHHTTNHLITNGSATNGHVSNGHVNGSNIIISNNNNNILVPASNKEAWSDFLGTLLPRPPKSEVFKTSGTGTLTLENTSGDLRFTQETLQTTNPNTNFSPQPLVGVPREVAQVFLSRYGKTQSGETSAPVKWTSGEALATPRKFPMEVPFFLKEMLAVKTSRSSCGNLKCQNTTTDDKPFKTCAKCNSVAYCSRDCQKEDWVKRHKLNCKSNATASEESRKTYAAQKIWSTSSIRHIIYLHWFSRFGKGVVVMMSRDFLASSYYDEEPGSRDLYLFYMPMADLLSEDCPIPSLKKYQAEFAKSFLNHDSETHTIATAAVDSTGFSTPHIDEVKTLQLKISKRSCKEDLQKVDAISVDSHNHATLYTFH